MNAEVFAGSVGNSLLVRKGNPRGITTIKDLFRSDIRVFMSNPQTEKASHVVYRETIEGMAANEGVARDVVDRFFSQEATLVFGQLIHHREAPQTVADGNADVAIVYDHLALRYTRIFPEIFERVPLQICDANITTRYAIALASNARDPAPELVKFFKGSTAADCYRQHGLAPVSP